MDTEREFTVMSYSLISIFDLSAGDNVLNLLLEKPKKIGIMIIIIMSCSRTHLIHNSQFIVAVDMNPAENALLELKIAAIKQLDYEDYLIVLGDKKGTEQKRYIAS